ncbi:MAG: DUF2027 domain-containing protein [Tannerellaceae bacterium]|jgi:hypothetical protein|nr:DUF2027 domain-containing protein [Tannerellaceae bacterium]
MEIKTGDKVRFLNSTGGGVVTRFQGKDCVLVEDADGFEIPALIRELVVVESLDKQTYTSRPKTLPMTEKPKPEPKPVPNPEKRIVEETPGGDKLNISLAYLPVDPKAMTQSSYEAYFINDSNYYLFFNYASRLNNSWVSRYNGVMDPNTKIFLEEFGKEKLGEMERLCIQFIAFKKDKPYLLKNAQSVELRLDTVKFYKVHCFTDNDYFEEDAMLVPIVSNDMPERELLVSAAELHEGIMHNTHARKSHKPAKKKAANEIIEVDLHLDKLIDNTNGLTNGDMLRYQVDKFHETLARYAGRKGKQIVFIHGKGNGILRTAIEKELRHRYPTYTFQDASFLEYGFGATMVTIR